MFLDDGEGEKEREKGREEKRERGRGIEYEGLKIIGPNIKGSKIKTENKKG